MAYINLDQYYQLLPEIDRADDFYPYWEKSIAEARSISLDPEIHDVSGAPSGYKARTISFRSMSRSQVKTRLYLPAKKQKPKAAIVVHDYNRQPFLPAEFPDRDTAWLFITLRGHDPLPVSENPEILSPGYFAENLIEKDLFYARAVYLDVIRALDMIRLMNDIDGSSIAIYGKGFGAAAALFGATFSNRVNAMVLDTPCFCNLPISQNQSTSEAASEINGFLEEKKGKRKTVKDNLSYFDALNVVENITCPVLVTMGYRDTNAPAECIMGLFNLLGAEKIIEVFPEDGHEAGGEAQRMKSFRWLSDRLNGKVRSGSAGS